MMRTSALVIMVASVSLGGCVFDDVVSSMQTSLVAAPTPVVAQVEPAALAGPNAIPWQLTPASTASVAQGETTVVVDKPGVGRIRGTETALAKLDERIVPYGADTQVVSACKDAFDPAGQEGRRLFGRGRSGGAREEERARPDPAGVLPHLLRGPEGSGGRGTTGLDRLLGRPQGRASQGLGRLISPKRA